MDCYRQPKLRLSEEDATEETERLLKSAFEYRMVADVPVGMFLSGGIDSSVVTALLQADRKEKLKTFTIGFNEKGYNEAEYAKEIAAYLGTDHTEYYCSQKDALDILPLLPEIWDEPFGDPSAIPTTLVSRLARQRVTVSLSADGGDEAFGGYNKYIGIYKKGTVLKKIPKVAYGLVKTSLKNYLFQSGAATLGMFDARNRLSRWAEMVGYDESEILSIDASKFSGNEYKEIIAGNISPLSTDFNERLESDEWLDNLLALDYKTYQIDDILTKVDRAGMSVSLEGREPLLDYRIIEFVSRLSPELKIRNGEKKYLLKQIAYKYIPRRLLDRPKMGFGIPLREWFREDLREYVSRYLDNGRITKEGILNPRAVAAVRDEYLSSERVSETKVWLILMFEMWKEKWIE
jgi:asparagine synthase (glutamine-hydrolysing)